MKKTNIQLLITGGTLDKDYNTTSGELVFTETHMNQLLNEANTSLTVESRVLMLKDSLEMTLSDREIIYQACLKTSSQQIIITHGTDTMSETALYLQSKTGLTDKTIILTGAMRPFKLGNSDASFNVASALMAVQLVSPGIYITMNGQIFAANNVQKNRTIGQFESH
ncbi:asparaginase [Thiomicrorhabdus lithotrophica]|uniref:Asparaginase n=1 Tax=Thiomicrorhabdus lithotrophica TaxID=2949997 RepID=A0ABY8CCN2_9GAMM|nr:asparaginase [Thiomicrorhabdus lithotrophica]WEJ63756.1 asparaginase [Thiomicrorhabdus lithotrophica]